MWKEMKRINRKEYEILKGLDNRWEWITRDNDTILRVYENEPKKHGYRWDDLSGVHGYYWDEPSGVCESVDSDSFQFIQWGDENPFSIAELIEEYEKESEEKEVKRDIEWAIQEIESLETEPSQNYPHDEMIEREIVLGILSQLDEPGGIEETTHLLESVLKENKRLGKLLEEKHEEWLELMDEINNRETLSEEWIGDSVEYAYYMTPRGTYSSAKAVIDPGKLKGILVPKQDLPVIPSFVAEFLKGKEEYMLYELLDNDFIYDDYDELARWLYDNDEDTNKERELSLVLAHMYGYKLEKEQKYFAKIKGHENISSDDKYWNYCITDESLDIGDNKVHADVLDEYVLSATKDEWENLGISEDNADFVEVEELEE